MELKKILAKEVGKFCISIESNDDGSGKTRIEGNALAIIGGMSTLANHIAKMFRKDSSSVYTAYLMSMLAAMFPDDEVDNKSESEPASDVNLSDIHPSVSPDQKKIDALFDKLFGGR